MLHRIINRQPDSTERRLGASADFPRPDGNLLEFPAMLPVEPRPEPGIINWINWKTRTVAAVPFINDHDLVGGRT